MTERKLVGTGEMFKKALAGKYAIGAYNVNNMEILQGIAEAAEETRSPIILQVSAGARKYANQTYLIKLVEAALATTTVPIALHLDHGADFEICKSCIDGGFSSVMIDGSALSLDDNVALTKEVVDIAHPEGVSVEGELGTIGGKEETEAEIKYTEVSEAVEFVARTGVDSLAVGVGTAHGVYKGVPHIAVDRIEEIAAAVDIPLVLHGASGLSDDVITACIKAGISKINFATQLRQAFTEGLKQGLKENPDAFVLPDLPTIFMEIDADVLLRDMDTYERYVRGPRLS